MEFFHSFHIATHSTDMQASLMDEVTTDEVHRTPLLMKYTGPLKLCDAIIHLGQMVILQNVLLQHGMWLAHYLLKQFKSFSFLGSC